MTRVPYWPVLAWPHLSMAGTRRPRVTRPDLSLLQGLVASEVLEATPSFVALLDEAAARARTEDA
jgi:hypothetical protein